MEDNLLWAAAGGVLVYWWLKRGKACGCESGPAHDAAPARDPAEPVAAGSACDCPAVY